MSKIPSSKSGTLIDRAYLKKFTDLYLDCLEKRDPKKLPVSPALKYTENEIEIRLGEGIWKTIDKIAYRMEIYDTKASSSAAEVIFEEKGKQAMLFLRLKIENDLISEIETLVTTEENVLTAPVPFNPATQPALSGNFKRSIRPAERDSRFTMMAVAEGYWRAMETEGTAEYRKTALLPDTERWENGMHTTNELWREPGPDNPMPNFQPVFPYPNKNPRTAMQDFDHGIWHGTRVYDRRYPVIDEERGIVLSMARFGSFARDMSDDPNAGPSPYVAEFFSVTDGKIREVHVVIAGIKPSIKTKWFCNPEYQ